MHILFCTTVLPSRKRTGGEIASQSFIDALRAAGHSVTVLGYQRPRDPDEPSVDEVCVGYRPIETDGAGLNKYLWLAGALGRGYPYSVFKYVSSAYTRLLRDKLASNPVSLVVIDHAQIGFLLEVVGSQCPIIFIAHNVEAHIYAALKQAGGGRIRRWLMAREARLIADMEQRLAVRSAVTWVLTEADRKYFYEVGATRVTVADIPATRFGSGITATSYAWDIGMIGTWTWRANAEGLEWFQRDVVPLIQDGQRIGVAGKGADSIVKDPIQALGFVTDAMSFLESCTVIAIPSTSGGGIQVKTLDAIATGRPVVATSVALRGINDLPPAVRRADSAEDFVQALVQAQLTESDEAASALAWSKARADRFRAVICDEVSAIERQLD